MIPEYYHKINERLDLFHEAPDGERLELTIRNPITEKWFNFITGAFEDYDSNNLTSYTEFLQPVNNMPGLYSITILSLPQIRQDLIFAYTDVNVPTSVGSTSFPYVVEETGTHVISFDVTQAGGTTPAAVEIAVDGVEAYVETGVDNTTVSVQQEFELTAGNEVTVTTVSGDGTITISNQDISYFRDVVTYERHVFGGKPGINEPTLCTVYGTLRDVSGTPLEGQKVEAYLNRAGFFTHKAGLIGYAATALTDADGRFEIPLVVGLDVTISVPIIGFTQRGFVPNLTAVELTSQTLLSYDPQYN